MALEMYIALIGLFGVLFTVFIQWIVSKNTIRSETERLHRHLSLEFQLAQFTEWQSQFQAVMADLLASTDPESNDTFEKKRIVPLVLKAQLMLNLTLSSHAKVNGLINQLALAINGWHGEQDLTTLLKIHAELLDSSRSVLYLPNK